MGSEAAAAAAAALPPLQRRRSADERCLVGRNQGPDSVANCLQQQRTAGTRRHIRTYYSLSHSYQYNAHTPLLLFSPRKANLGPVSSVIICRAVHHTLERHLSQL